MIPADPQLTMPARLVLQYLEATHAEGKTLTAVMKADERRELFHGITGKYPAIAANDLSGWHTPKWNWIYERNIRDRTIPPLRTNWDSYGAILSLSFHWANPLDPVGGNFKDTQQNLTKEQWEAIVTPDTPEYETMIADYRRHMEYLRPLVEADIPILWRPLHEIDGGWFWWTCEHDPSKTAELWKILYRENVESLGFHNLIYVYSCGEKVGPKNLNVVTVEDRLLYYPGSDYVDIIGVDLYHWDYRTGIRKYWNGQVTYRSVFDVIQAIDPTKMVALCECQALPNPEPAPEHADNFAPWAWALPWYYANPKQNPTEWMQEVHAHPRYIHALK